MATAHLKSPIHLSAWKVHSPKFIIETFLVYGAENEKPRKRKGLKGPGPKSRHERT